MAGVQPGREPALNGIGSVLMELENYAFVSTFKRLVDQRQCCSVIAKLQVCHTKICYSCQGSVMIAPK